MGYLIFVGWMGFVALYVVGRSYERKADLAETFPPRTRAMAQAARRNLVVGNICYGLAAGLGVVLVFAALVWGSNRADAAPAKPGPIACIPNHHVYPCPAKPGPVNMIRHALVPVPPSIPGQR